MITTSQWKPMPVSKRSTGGDAIYVDRNGNTDALPPLKPSTKGNVKAHDSTVSSALPIVGGVQVQQLFEEETNQQNKNKIANEMHGLPAVHRPASVSGNGSPASGRRPSTNGSGSLKARGLPISPETAMKQFMHKLTSFEHHEIFNYPEIWFVGPNAKTIKAPTSKFHMTTSLIAMKLSKLSVKEALDKS